MVIRYFKIVVFAFISLFLFSINSQAQKNGNESDIKVMMRMIGHQVLLNIDDSTSRVLPIQKGKKGNQYKIEFETDFQFDPNDLVAIINDIIKETKIINYYLVEVESCEEEEVIYSYKITDSVPLDLVPCGGRIIPKACYHILISILESGEAAIILPVYNSGSSRGFFSDSKSIDYSKIGILIILPLYLIGFTVSFWKRRGKTEMKSTPDMITIGKYRFDKRSMELTHDDKKVELTGKEADLLVLLYNDANTVLERETILKKVWGDEGDYVGRTLDVFISKLRKKLEADTNVKIINIRGVGYKLIIDV
ncbi:MAG: hypothetical protein ACI97N_002010 [Cognaticolwellia sp.]|jgi:hypothetical protein